MGHRRVRGACRAHDAFVERTVPAAGIDPQGFSQLRRPADLFPAMARTEQRITLWNVSFFSRPAAQDALPAESAASEEAGPLPEEAPSP